MQLGGPATLQEVVGAGGVKLQPEVPVPLGALDHRDDPGRDPVVGRPAHPCPQIAKIIEAHNDYADAVSELRASTFLAGQEFAPPGLGPAG